MIELDDGTESGAWLSLGDRQRHELIYVADAHGRPFGRLHHVAFWVDTREEVLRAADLFLDAGVFIEAGAVQAHPIHSVLPLRLRAGRQPDRGHVRRIPRVRSDPEPTVCTEAERARGQAWGVKTVESFAHVRHAAGLGGTNFCWAGGEP